MPNGVCFRRRDVASICDRRALMKCDSSKRLFLAAWEFSTLGGERRRGEDEGTGEAVQYTRTSCVIGTPSAISGSTHLGSQETRRTLSEM